MITALEKIKAFLSGKEFLTTDEIEKILDDKKMSQKERSAILKFLIDNDIEIVEGEPKEVSEDIISDDDIIETPQEELGVAKTEGAIYGHVEKFLNANNITLDAEAEEEFVKQIDIYADEEYIVRNILEFLEPRQLSESIDEKTLVTLAKRIRKENARLFETSRYIDDSVKMYLADIGRTPLYTYEEEKKAAYAIKYQREKVEKIKEEDPDNPNLITEEEKLKSLMQEFATHNLRLVVSIAKRHCTNPDDLLDLIQEGNIGLQKAIEKYDVDKGYKFSTYATWWIKQSITRSIADHSRTIRIPVHLHEQIGKLRKTEKVLTTKLGRVPTNAELAKALDKSVEKIEELKQIAISPISIDSPIKSDDGDQDSLLVDFIKDENANPEEETVQEELREGVSKLLKLIDKPRARRVIIYRFGLYDQNFSAEQLEATRLRYVIATLPLEIIRELPEPVMEDVIRNMTTRNIDIVKDYMLSNLPEELKDEEMRKIDQDYLNRLSNVERRKIYTDLYGTSILESGKSLKRVDSIIKEFFARMDVYELRKLCEEKLSSESKGIILRGMPAAEKNKVINNLDESKLDESLLFAKRVIDIKEEKVTAYPRKNYSTYEDTIESSTMKNIVYNDPYRENVDVDEYTDAAIVAKNYQELFNKYINPSTLLFIQNNFVQRYNVAYRKFQQATVATLEDIGNLEDVTRERIRQIEAKTLKQLKMKEKRKVVSLKTYISTD